MIILGLDTTGAHCSAALVNQTDVLAHKSEEIGRGHAERLAPMVLEVLAEANLTAADVTKLSVCTGPGSFTGLRVALAFAKGFALPRKLPVVGIDALEVSAKMIASSHDDHLIGVLRDIRRNEVFYGNYSWGVPLEPPRAMSITEAEAEADILQASIYEADNIDTRVLAKLAIDKSSENYPAVPLYSRAPDAKLPGGIAPNA